MSETVVKGEIIPRLLYEEPRRKKTIALEKDVPFYQLQKRIIFENNGFIDPTEIKDYLALDGYKALTKALFEMTAEEIIQEIKLSGLRGRGGRWIFDRDQMGDLPTGRLRYQVSHLQCR